MAGLDEFTRTTEQLHVMQVEYEEQFGDPIVHLWCRTRSGERRWIEVEGFKPRFYIHKDAFSKRIVNHDWVEGVDAGTTSLYGEDLVEVQTRLPWHVGGKQDKKGLREYFDRTWEADVFFTSRFLIDTGIKTHLEVDKDATWDGQSVSGDYRVGVDDIDPVEDPSWRATPRVITVDIEVLSPDGFPNPSDAEHPVTAITAHDNHTDDYTVWVLRYEGWGYTDTEVQNLAIDNRPDGVDVDDVRVYDDEGALLHHFNEWVEEREPDLLSGWNSSTTDNGRPFDYPYIINRCQSLNVMNYRDWSPLGQVWDGNWGPGGKGVGFFDMLKGYKKTQWQKPKGGYSLGNIADKELGYGKEDIEDIDTAWRDDVGTFLKYNMRDVSATVGINESADVIDLFQNIRALAGVQFENCHNNIDLLDVFILRYAHEMGVALPTNEEPDRDWYYGAHVFEPTIGRHPNVVYPDLWSMYPNMIRNVNMSPETLIGTRDDLRQSEYTEEDCRWTYIDTRQTNVKESDSPRYEKLYFLDPEIEEGFMTRVVDDLMGLKDHYDGTPLYDAVKRIVNSVYGVYGDSDSYGKGYRLFDWRIAEGITLGGRRMIQDSADQFIDAVNDIKHERGLDGNKAYLVGGDTDSVMTAMPFAEGDEQCVEIALAAAERVNEWYDEWTTETFNLHGDHYCELEIESYAPWCFVPEGKTKDKAKKRYAEIVAWEEGEWFDPPEFSITGMDVVRSDRAVVTREMVQSVVEDILRIDDRDEARNAVYESISDVVERIESGEAANSYIARPKGMGQHPSKYGSPDRRPQSTYRGAKYANKHFDWEQLGEGSKPQLLYIETVRGDWPVYYDAETAEDGDEVDAVAVEQPDKVPDEFVVDTEVMIDKVLRDPLEPILGAMRWNFEDAISDTEQASVSQFM